VKRLIPLLLCLVSVLRATTWYVDGALATGSNDGTSWPNAWKTLGAITGLAAGDTVYISGGSSGATLNYNISSEFTSIPGFISGTPGNPVTYKIGQDSAHNGTAIFNRITSGSQLLFGHSNYVFSGDAGDGQMHFSTSNYISGFILNNDSNVRISYVNFGHIVQGGVINTATGIELDHSYIYVTGVSTSTGFTAILLTGATYGVNIFHHNIIYVPYDPTLNGNGSDGCQIGGDGWSLYNNTIVGYPLTGANGNHQDGWQGSGGNFIKIYNNLIVDMANYGLFPEGYTVAKSYNHVKIYNNIITSTRDNVSQGMAISASGTFPITDFVCINNLVDRYTSGNPYTFRYPGGPAPGAFIDCFFENNISVNSGSNVIDSTVNSVDNVSVSSGNASIYFTDWTINGGGANNYHLIAGASSLIGSASDASSFIGNLDADGVARIVPWDVGPYKYIASISAPLITLNPTSQSVVAGANVTFNAMASGNPTPTWQWNKNASPIGGATSATLVLMNVSSGDAASYTATATNTAGSATSSTATLAVTSPIPGPGSPGTPIITGVIP